MIIPDGKTWLLADVFDDVGVKDSIFKQLNLSISGKTTTDILKFLSWILFWWKKDVLDDVRVNDSVF